MKFLENLTDVQVEALNGAIRALSSRDEFTYVSDTLRHAFERTPRTREAWIHTRHLMDNVLDGEQMTVYKHDPGLSNNGFIKVSITEIL